MFSTESLKAGNKDQPKFLDNIFSGKAIGVNAKFVKIKYTLNKN